MTHDSDRISPTFVDRPVLGRPSMLLATLVAVAAIALIPLAALMALAGGGDKVANCVLLFSLDKPEAFPVDVWIQRALQEWYLDGGERQLSKLNMRLWARDRFGPHAGYANQYLFHGRRLER